MLPLANRPEVWGFCARGLHIPWSPVLVALVLNGFKADGAELAVAELYWVTSMLVHGLLSSGS